MRLALLTVAAVVAACGGAAPTPSAPVEHAPIERAAAKPASPCADGMAFVPAATVALGTPRRPPVDLHAFCMDVTEVTIAAYEACVAAGACPDRDHPNCDYGKADHAAHPAHCIEQADAAAFCAFRGGRLPTPDEWEYAARGPEERSYPWGDQRPGDRACWGDRADTCEVGTHAEDRSPFGILDLAGNVREWTSGDATGPVVRGGSYMDEHPALLHVTYEERWPADHRMTNLGARCVARPLR